MAHFHRVVLGALLLCLTSTAFASFPSTSGYSFGSRFGNNGSPTAVTASTALGACQAAVAADIASGRNNVVIFSSSVAADGYNMFCDIYQNGSRIYTTTTQRSSVLTCPANTSGSGTSSCTCNSGYVQVGTTATATCQSPAQVAQGVCDQLNASGAPLVASNTAIGGLNSCYQGYVVKATGAAFGIKNGVAGPGSFFGPFSCSGATCTGQATGGSSSDTTTAPDATPTPSAANCKSTEYWGSVNGIGTCIKSDNTSFGGNNNAAPTPAGSASAPSSGLGTNAPPSATGSSQQTTCIGGSCTTTTTYTNGTGATVGTATETKPQLSFCKDNPGASVCVQSSLGGTACGTPDVCTGDAIQCAINAQSKATTCALTTAPLGDANITAFNTAAAQAQGDQTGALTSTVNLGPSAFDQSNPLGAATGLSDVTVTVWSTPVTLPFSNVNPWLSRIGLLFQGVTFLLCARIVLRG